MNNNYALRHLLCTHSAAVAATRVRRSNNIITEPKTLVEQRFDIAKKCWDDTCKVMWWVDVKARRTKSWQYEIGLQLKERLLRTLELDYIPPPDADEYWEAYKKYLLVEMFSSEEICSLQSAGQINNVGLFKPVWTCVAPATVGGGKWLRITRSKRYKRYRVMDTDIRYDLLDAGDDGETTETEVEEAPKPTKPAERRRRGRPRKTPIPEEKKPKPKPPAVAVAKEEIEVAAIALSQMEDSCAWWVSMPEATTELDVYQNFETVFDMTP